MAENILGGLLGAGNRTRAFLRGLLSDPRTTVGDLATAINAGLLEQQGQDVADFQTQMYRGAMSDDPSTLAAKAAAEERQIERGVGLLGVGSVGAKASKKTAKDVVENAFGPKRSKVRVGTTGQYVGAPPGVNTPQKMGAIVARYQDAMETGFPGRTFYRDSSDDIWARSGHDMNEADLFAQNLALLSRSNNVGGNTTMSTKGHLQAVTGDPIRTGRFPSKDSPPLQEMYNANAVEYLGHKRDPFATQLGVRWAPQRIGRGVNDMHEAELMGYPSGKVAGETQHAFMDDIRSRAIRLANEKNLGGVSDWDTGTAQAAAWTGNKIRRGEVTPGEAAKSYADYLPLHEANATYEAVSAPVTGHLKGLLDAPWEVKQAYTQHPAGSWATSPSGRDIGYTAARMLPGETAEAIGRYEGGSNPALVARPLVGTETRADGSRGLTAGSTRAMDAVEAARAYFDAQAAGAWHKLMPAKSATDYSGAYIDLGRPMTEADMLKLAPIFERKGYWLASSPRGMTVIANDATATGKAFADDVRKLVKENKVGGKLEFGAIESGYVDYSGAWPKRKGAVTEELLKRIEAAPQTAGYLERSQGYRDTVLARNTRDIEAQAKGYGVAQEDVLRAREIFAKEGWDGLRRAAKAGLVPAVLLSAFGPGLLGEAANQTVR